MSRLYDYLEMAVNEQEAIDSTMKRLCVEATKEKYGESNVSFSFKKGPRWRRTYANVGYSERTSDAWHELVLNGEFEKASSKELFESIKQYLIKRSDVKQSKTNPEFYVYKNRIAFKVNLNSVQFGHVSRLNVQKENDNTIKNNFKSK